MSKKCRKGDGWTRRTGRQPNGEHWPTEHRKHVTGEELANGRFRVRMPGFGTIEFDPDMTEGGEFSDAPVSMPYDDSIFRARGIIERGPTGIKGDFHASDDEGDFVRGHFEFLDGSKST